MRAKMIKHKIVMRDEKTNPKLGTAVLIFVLNLNQVFNSLIINEVLNLIKIVMRDESQTRNWELQFSFSC